AGTYHWTAHYSGDTNNNPADSACADEVVILRSEERRVGKERNPPGGTVGATLNDSATVSGGFSPTGTVSFALYGPNNLTCSPTGAAPFYTQTLHTTAIRAWSTPVCTSTPAGTYHWTAHYSGDTNNNPADSACADEVVIL